MTDPKLANEGCSNAIMEHIACDLPVVSREGGGNPALVEHGVTGLVIPANSPREPIRAPTTLRADGQLIVRLREADAWLLLATHCPALSISPHLTLHTAAIESGSEPEERSASGDESP